MDNQHNIDTLLIQRAQKGEQRAFELLASKYRRRLKSVLIPLLQDEAEAEDVVQEALVRAHQSLASFRGDSSWFTWLYRIGVNIAKNMLAARGRRLPSVDESQDYPDTPAPDTPETELVSKEIVSAIEKALATLPESLRIAIELREFDHLSYEEIAERMDIPIGTVRSRIFRAREALANAVRPFLAD